MGIIHRDFKPANVILGKDGRVRVLDFGLAAAVGEQASSEPPSGSGSLPRTSSLDISLTATGTLMGTPAYMAPEQHAGMSADERTDQFAFCASLYEALYGERPFAGNDLFVLARLKQEGTISPPPAGTQVPAWLRSVVVRGLATRPEDRWPSMAALIWPSTASAEPASWRRGFPLVRFSAMRESEMSAIEIRCLTGQAIHPYLPEVARLRIEVFREYPYLYDGSEDYEQRYLATYASNPESLFVLALDHRVVVGAATGVPMAGEEDSFKQPFLDRGHDPAQIFYFGESVLQKEYRGQGLGVRFFIEREAYARGLGRFVWTCFCAVQRPAEHPARPAGYVPMNDFWQRRGYVEHPELTTTYSWKEVGEPAESPKPMTFWIKRLETGS